MSIGHRVTCGSCNGAGGMQTPTGWQVCGPCNGQGYRWTSPTPDAKPDRTRKDRRG